MSALTRVQLLPEARAELVPLGDPDVQKAVIEASLMIENDLDFGAPLRENPATGNLRGCRKVYVDKPTDDKPRYRIVYWLSPSEAGRVRPDCDRYPGGDSCSGLGGGTGRVGPGGDS